MNSRRFLLLAVSLIFCFAILAPTAVYSGPTDPNSYDDHPWGGEEPPVDPDPGGFYVVEIGGPIIVIDISGLISLDRTDRVLNKSDVTPTNYIIDDVSVKSSTTISNGNRMSTAKRY